MPKNMLIAIKKGRMNMAAKIFGNIKYPAEFIPIISKASICSVIRIEPISEAMFEPIFPANIKHTMVGENSNNMDSRVVNPKAYNGIIGLVKPKAACMVITPPIKKEMIEMMGNEPIPMLSIS